MQKMKYPIKNIMFLTERKGITNLKFSQYWMFHHRVIETCFEMLKSSEEEKLWGRNYMDPLICKIVLKLEWCNSVLDLKKRGAENIKVVDRETILI